MIAGMRAGAHPVVEHALGRGGREVERAGVDEHLLPRQTTPIQRLRERWQPRRVFMNDVNAAHLFVPQIA